MAKREFHVIVNNQILTVGSPYKTGRIITLTFNVPEFSTSKDIAWQVDMDSGKLEKLSYGMIIDRDPLHALKVIIDFEYQVIKWDDVSIEIYDEVW